jgi:hypothetical protein
VRLTQTHAEPSILSHTQLKTTLYLSSNVPTSEYRDYRPEVILSLCTGVSLYAPYSLLLISNKLWMGGWGWEGGDLVGEKLGGGVGGGE